MKNEVGDISLNEAAAVRLMADGLRPYSIKNKAQVGTSIARPLFLPLAVSRLQAASGGVGLLGKQFGFYAFFRTLRAVDN